MGSNGMFFKPILHDALDNCVVSGLLYCTLPCNQLLSGVLVYPLSTDLYWFYQCSYGVVAMTPEEIEIQKKKQQVLALEDQLANIDAEFADLCLQVEDFQQVYLQEMGPLYAQLDRWNLRIACTGLVIDRLRDVRDGLRPLPEDPFEWSASSMEEARQEWARRHEKTSAGNSEADTVQSPQTPNEKRTIKELYRQLVKRYHPDLVNDPQAQQRRTEIMMEINEAYQQQDIVALKELLSRPSIVEVDSEGDGDVLIRLIRRIAQLQSLIEQSNQRISKEKEGELMQLYVQCQACETQYGDPFYVLKQAVHEQVARAKLEWMHQRARESKLWTEVEA